MEKLIRMVVSSVLTVAILLQVTTAASTEHFVGDNFGWSIPINGAAAYKMWAEANTINVGDTLVFKFTEGNHNVQEVSRSSFEECSTRNSVGQVYKKGPVNITVQTLGDHYYICTVGQHCLAGQKMAIKVSGPKATNTSTGTTPPPSSSSSNVVFASFLLSLSSIALTIFL